MNTGIGTLITTNLIMLNPLTSNIPSYRAETSELME